ncbi:MAG: glycosyltransferase, partial [Pseudomonadota bacterium]
MTRICVVMAVYQPQPDFLYEQMASIARQTHTQHDLVCVVADRVSTPMIEAAALDAGVSVDLVQPDLQLDAVRAFECGLSHAMSLFPDTQFFAFADQDDIWSEDKLSTGLRRLIADGTDLVHSDASLIDHRGRTIATSLFDHDRRPCRDDPRTLLYGNTVTGMTALFRRDVAKRALPFPPQDGVHFYHDLWLALIAATGAGISRIKEPLVAYRQHAANAVGAGKTSAPKTIRQSAASYALARYLAIAARERGGRTQALRPFWKPLRLPAFMGDALRLALWGDRPSATQALRFAAVSAARPLWAVGKLAAKLGSGALRAELTHLDQKLYRMSPGQQPELAAPATETPPAPPSSAEPWWVHFDPRTRVKWTPDPTAPHPAINLLVPSLNPSEIFAGIATAVDLGLALAKHGHDVRFIATDLPIAAPAASLGFVLSRGSDPALRARINLACGVTSDRIPTHPSDNYIATAWWTAHVANALMSEPGQEAR